MSGLLYPTMLAVEDALLALLRTDQRLKDWDVSVVAVPGFNSNRVSDKEDVPQLFKKFPGVGTYLPTGEFSKDGNRRSLETAPVWIFCAGQSLGMDPADPRRSSPDHPGSMQLMERCRQLTEGWKPGGNIEFFAPKTWRAVWSNKQISVHALLCECRLARPVPPTMEENDAYGSSYG